MILIKFTYCWSTTFPEGNKDMIASVITLTIALQTTIYKIDFSIDLFSEMNESLIMKNKKPGRT